MRQFITYNRKNEKILFLHIIYFWTDKNLIEVPYT